MSSQLAVPQQGDWNRFKDSLPGHAEYTGLYAPGGYHPVALGDKFDGGRYTIVAKLGHGAVSTVWLAQQASEPKFVALKIMRASRCDPQIQQELNMLAMMANIQSEFIVRSLDTFVHPGINGKHQCIVYEAMGGSIYGILDSNPAFEVEERMSSPDRDQSYEDIFQRCPTHVVPKMLYKTLTALASLHSNNIVHGDLSQQNILVSIDLSKLGEIKNSGRRLQRKDEQQDFWAPSVVYAGSSLYPYVNFDAEFIIKLSDFGGTFFASQPLPKLETPRGLKSPEALIGLPVSTSLDIWSFGCLIYELYTGDQLFTSANDTGGCILNMERRLGPIPPEMIKLWPERDELYDSEGALLQEWVNQISYDSSLESWFKCKKPKSIGDAEAAEICKVVRHCLDYNVNTRPTAEQLLLHPFFANIKC